jgi:uncharacterized repeat protein (TIGR01451 family)
MLKTNHIPRRLLRAAVLLLCGMCPVFGANLKILHGHVPKIVSRLTPEGWLPATNELRLALGLPLRDPAGLDNLLAQVYDPASTNYHKFLTPPEFTARFGPTEADYAAVKNFARTNGLAVAAVHGDRLLLDVTGPAAAVEKAFHVKLRTYRHPSGNRSFFAPDTEPEVDASLPVADIEGLSDFSRPHPKLHPMPAAALAKLVSRNGSAPDGSGAYFGDDFRKAYLPGTTLTGAGQMVGLIEFDGFYSSDIASYAAAAGNGRSNIPIQTVLVDGFNGSPGSGNSEVALDIEMAMAMAPGLSRIVVFEGAANASQNDLLDKMAADSAVKNLSCCWGWGGGPSTTTDAIFKKMAAQGQSFFNASGDSDAFTMGAGSTNAVDNPSLALAPSSCPYITQVGGTTLTTAANAAYGSETVWNWNNSGQPGVGSSGGISSHYAIPAWQANVSMADNQGSPTCRNIPDVALVADTVFTYSDDGSPGVVGGTSCAAPLWAGLTALANQEAAADGQPPVGFINPVVYAIGAGSAYPRDFHDTISGDNTWSGSPANFHAVPGYDLCTGWGTPAGQGFIDDLIGVPDPLEVVSGPTGATNVVGESFVSPASVAVLTNSGTAPLTWKLMNPKTATWLAISPVGGTLAPQATTNVMLNYSSSAAKLAAGKYSASLVFSNLTAAAARSFTYQLQLLPVLSVLPATGFTAIGPVGGSSFVPATQDFTISNLGGTSAVWKVAGSSAWLAVNQSTGTVAAAGQDAFTVGLTAKANTLKAGIYKTALSVRNKKNQIVQKLPFVLLVGQNIASNGGFETGNFTGWTLNADAGFTVVTNRSGFVHTGRYGAALGQANSIGYLSQTVPTVAGQTYQLSLWIDNPKNSNGPIPNEFLVQWEGATIYDAVNLPFIGWTNLQFTVTATGSGSLLQLGFQDDPYFLGLDDISVKPIPAPHPVASLAAEPARKILAGRVVSLTAHLSPNGLVPPTNILRLALGLPLRNPAGLDELIGQLYNPASTNYHKFLTPPEFTARFGPTEQEYAAVAAFARSNGFSVVSTHSSRMVLDVSAPAANVEHAFGVTLRTYRHPTEPRDFFAPDVEPSVPANVPVADVWGLSDYALPHPLARTANPASATPLTYNGSGANGSYRGADFRNAFAPGTSLTGRGQTAAVAEFDGYYPADIASYEAQSGYPEVPLNNVLINVTGTPGYSGLADAVMEVSLDIELAIAMAPGLSQMIVYEGSNPYDVFNRIASDNTAKQISCSWTWGNGPSSNWAGSGSTLDSLLEKMAAQGQAFFQASGDSDAYTGSQALNSSTGPIPVDSIYVTSVGGTSLSMNGAGASWASETVWNWNSSGSPDVGSGGGISPNYSIPSWQTNVSMAANGGSAVYRNIPDVAMPAEAIYVIYDNGSSSGYIGGTSAAAPLWAGFCALINQQSFAATGTSIGFLNPAIYKLAATASYASCFHDVTAGDNIGTNASNLFNAAAGYDLCTGLGSPNGTNLINALVPPVYFTAMTNAGWALLAESATPANGAIDPGETVTVSFTLQNQGTLPPGNLVAALLPNAGVLVPSGPQTYGAVPAYGGSASRPFAFTAAGTCGSNIVADLQLQDGTNNLGTVSFILPLGKTSGLSQNFDGVAAPSLPSGWTSVNVSGTANSWNTTSASYDTAPNSAFVSDSTSSGQNALVSPVIPISSANARLSFRQNYSLEYVSSGGHNKQTYTNYDGGVLEIQIGSGAFADILAAGGNFVTGGYNGSITTTSDNPLGGRSAWVGSPGVWQTVTVNLPASAAGQNVQLRWNCATDTGNAGGNAVGWSVDSISITDSVTTCLSVFTDLAAGQSLDTNSLQSGQNLIYTLTVTNLGPQPAANVILTDSVPANIKLVSASPGYSYSDGQVVWPVGMLGASASTNFMLTLAPASGNVFTNFINVGTVTPEITLANNMATLVSTQAVMTPPPVISSVAANPGGSVTLQLAGAPGFVYILQATTNLFPPQSWLPIATNTLGTNGVWQFTDMAATNFPQQFYRLELSQ